MSSRTEIESLWRIKLSYLKPLIDASKELRNLSHAEKKVRVLKWGVTLKREYYAFTEELALRVYYFFKPRISVVTGEEILEEAIRFIWEAPDGTERKMEIELEYRESNLGKGYREYYFRDRGYNLCRTLYSDRWGMYSREQLRGKVIYRLQKESHKLREYRKHERADNILSLVGTGRHLLWKGQPTPFAKQAIKAKMLRETEPDIFTATFIDRRKYRKSKSSSRSRAIRRNIGID